MKALTKMLLVALLVVGLSNVALATPAATDATASVTVTVDDIMEWSGDFSVSRQQKWHRLKLLVRGGPQVFSCMQENT